MKNVSYIAERCTGCTACLNSCHKNAIQMKSDAIGFLYPLIDTSLCINCGKCVSVCPASEEAEGKQTRINAYYGAIADSEIVKKSSSGGAFTLMASNILSQKGLVIGAAIDYKSLDVVYSSTDSCTLDDLRRSKYVSSYPKDIFSEIEKALKVNRAVLFCGLPCHVDGLKHFLKKDYDNLITCDFICGGTASPRFFKEHIKNLEKKYKAKNTI